MGVEGLIAQKSVHVGAWERGSRVKRRLTPFFGPLKEMVGVKMMVLLEAVRHATPQQSKRHRL